MRRPPPGSMCYWRAKGSLEWRFGYCTYETEQLVRMGRWNGDTTGGVVVDHWEIEWKPY
jgi:hypothetical protein